MLGLCLLGAGVAFGQYNIVDKGGLPINAEFDKADVREILPFLFRDYASFVVALGVSGDVMASYHRLLRDEVLTKILAQVNSTFEVVNGVYFVFPVHAQTWNSAQMDSLQVQELTTVVDVPVRTAIQLLFKGRGPVIIFPGVHGLVSGDYSGYSLELALQAFCKQVNATYRVEDEIYVILPRLSDGPDANMYLAAHDRDYSLSLDGTPARGALDVLLRDSLGTNLSLDPDGNGLVTIHGDFPSSLSAASAVADRANFEVFLEKGSFHVANSTRHYVFDFSKTDVRDALRAMFRQVNYNYSIAPEVQGPITGHFEGPFEDVLSQVVAQAHGWYGINSGVFQIMKQPDPLLGQTGFAERVYMPRVTVPAEFDKIVLRRNLAFKDVSIQDVLATICTIIPYRYKINPNDKARITADLGEKSLSQALTIIANQSNNRVRFEHGQFIFTWGAQPYLEIVH